MFRYVANNPEILNFSYEEILFLVQSNNLYAKETQVQDFLIKYIKTVGSRTRDV